MPVFVPPRLRQALVAGVIIAIMVHIGLIAYHHAGHPGDYEISREFGRRFLANEYLYRDGLHFPYLPSAAMYFAPLALVPVQVGIIARYCLAVFCVWLVLKLLFTMVSPLSSRLASRRFSVNTLTIVLASHYLIRDLDDGGPHIVLMAMLVGGVFCAWRNKPALAGLWFGLATALKVTPGIFVAFFAWKHQWRLAIFSALAALCFILLPAVRMGSANWWRHQSEWVRSSVGFMLNRNLAATAYYGDQSVQNQGLRPALIKWAGLFTNGRLSTKTSVSQAAEQRARLIALAIELLLLGWFCWLTRRPYREPSDPALLTESSALMVLAVLISPINWVQHLVFVFPALYLIVAEQLAIRRLGRASEAALILFAAIELLLNREFLGKPAYSLLLAARIHAISMLLLLGIITLRRPAATSAKPETGMLARGHGE